MTLMRLKLSIILSFALCLCAKSVAAPIAVTGGSTFIQLDVNVMRALDLSIESVSGADLLSMPGFIGLPMNSQEADPATTFVFDSENFSPSSGEIEHTGIITFNGDNAVGNFEFAELEGRPAGTSGFVLRTTLFPDPANNIPVFDIPAFGGGPSDALLVYGEDFLNIDGPILLSPEMSFVLAGDLSLTGTVSGAVKQRAEGVLVPEPTSLALALLALIGISVVITRK